MGNMKSRISRRAWKLYINTYEKLRQDRLLSSKKLGNNGDILSQIFSDLMHLEIHGLMGISEEHILQLRNALCKHREALLEDPGEYFTKQEVEAIIAVILTCLDTGIVPQSALFWGSDKQSRDECERIKRELEIRGMIREEE